MIFVSSFGGLTRREAEIEGPGLDVDDKGVDMADVVYMVLVKSKRWCSLKSLKHPDDGDDDRTRVAIAD